MGRLLYGALSTARLPVSGGERGFSPLIITAAVSVIALLAVVGWDIENTAQQKAAATAFVAETNAGTGALVSQDTANSAQLSAGTDASPGTSATSTDLISYIGPAVMNSLQNSYAQMQAQGTYTEAEGEQLAQDIAPLVRAEVSYQTYSEADIKTEPDTSSTRVLSYRSDLRVALAPLLKNTEPEYEIFAYYAQTKDKMYLTKLASVVQNYRAAIAASAKVTVPEDAVSYQVGILNAMEEFAATLDAMGAHADDPFASVALLRTYDQAEADVLTSFNNLAGYYRTKTQ